MTSMGAKGAFDVVIMANTVVSSKWDSSGQAHCSMRDDAGR
jgi:hypothetical protein